MDDKHKIVYSLNSKSEGVWELIKEALDKSFNGKVKEEDLEKAKETYDECCKEDINKGFYRYMIIEDYNIQDDLYWGFYKEKEVKDDGGEERFGKIFEDYFRDCDGGWEMILLIDMKELKAYQIDKNVRYISEEVK